jgi:hypothetical protein
MMISSDSGRGTRDAVKDVPYFRLFYSDASRAIVRCRDDARNGFFGWRV